MNSVQRRVLQKQVKQATLDKITLSANLVCVLKAQTQTFLIRIPRIWLLWNCEKATQ